LCPFKGGLKISNNGNKITIFLIENNACSLEKIWKIHTQR
jgi:hypothetical protein